MMLLGERIGDRYQIKRKLSNKPGRQTLLVEDLVTQKLIVVKVLWFHELFQWSDLKLFEREAETLRHLDHPAIPKYLDYFEIEHDGIHGFALVQTYIEAPSLGATIEQGRKFSEDELIELATKLLEILSYLHQQHPPVIHRDLKPSNILIDNRSGNSMGELYLVDFGSVQTAASQNEGTFTIVGTYGYVPLEQFGGRTVPASDLYSLGMTLVYVLTGVHPAELPLVDGRVDYQEYALNGRFNRWLEKITHPHLERRFDSAQAARTALLSSDGSTGDLHHLRPGNSEVELYRDRHKLEITYPEEPGYSGISCLITFVLGIFGFVLLGGFIIPLAIIFMIFGWAKAINGIFNELLEKKRLRTIYIDRRQTIKAGYHDRKSAQIEWQENSGSERKIGFVAYNPGYTFDKYLDATGKTIRGGKVEIKPKLSIYIYLEHTEFLIGNSTFSQPELWWLGQEICDFLGTELQVIYPTPKAPAEPSCGGGC